MVGLSTPTGAESCSGVAQFALQQLAALLGWGSRSCLARAAGLAWPGQQVLLGWGSKLCAC